MSETYGVLGATGQQGGAVVNALLDRGVAVRAVVRDPQSSAASALAERGVSVVRGDQDDAAAMGDALGGLTALFVMTTFADASGTEGEVRRGYAVARAAASAGVERVVYSSVGGAERGSGIPHFESKFRVEQRLRDLLPTVVVRPTFFMDNLAGQLDAADDGGEVVLRLPMPGDVSLQMIAVRDIGVVCAAALLDPGALAGDALEIAGDALTGEQIAARVAERSGRPARFEALPLDSLGDDEDMKAMFAWFVQSPAYAADFARTRAIDPGVLDFAGWLAQR